MRITGDLQTTGSMLLIYIIYLFSKTINLHMIN